jgi:hypothetical protein
VLRVDTDDCTGPREEEGAAGTDVGLRGGGVVWGRDVEGGRGVTWVAWGSALASRVERPRMRGKERRGGDGEEIRDDE